jgi:hypothetical protein
MKRLLVMVGATVGGSIGWWAGSGVGIMTAFLLSVVGTAAGIYAAIKVYENYLP